MGERWTDATRDLVATTIAAHVDHITSGLELACTCGGWRRPFVHDDRDPGPAARDFSAHRADAVLTALADAGLLIPPGGRLWVQVSEDDEMGW